MILKHTMAQLVVDAGDLYKLNQEQPDPHWLICQTLAGKYDLFEKDRLPLWLCYVVEGTMREIQESN